MTKFDVVVAWPRNADYPLWRQFIRDNRERFNLVIVVFTETHQGDDYRDFVREAMAEDWVLFADSPSVPGRDWRDVAVNHALVQSYNAQWVWFTEQDFIPGVDFWKILDINESVGVRAIGVKQGERLHPCSLFLRRDLLNELDKDFGISRFGKYDHFGRIQEQLEEKKEPIGIIAEEYWGHMNGLSHNMTLVYNGALPNYEQTVFNVYLEDCLKVTVPLDNRFVSWVKAYFDRVGLK